MPSARGCSRAIAKCSSGPEAAGRACTTLARLLQLNFETYLPDDLHVKMDRMSMAHALETRSPFLDTAVVEFGAALPDQLRMRLGKGKIAAAPRDEGHPARTRFSLAARWASARRSALGFAAS